MLSSGSLKWQKIEVLLKMIRADGSFVRCKANNRATIHSIQQYVYSGTKICLQWVQMPVLHSQIWVRAIWSGRQTPERRGVWWVTELEETTFVSESVRFLCARWIFSFFRRTTCVMTNVVSPGRILSRHKCDVETRSLQFAHNENGFHSEAGDNLCPTIKA